MNTAMIIISTWIAVSMAVIGLWMLLKHLNAYLNKIITKYPINKK